MTHLTQTMYAHVPAAKAATAFVTRRIVRLNAAGIALAVLLSALYIGQVNAAVSKSYAMRDLERQTQALAEENGKSELAVSRIQTLDHVEAATKILGLVPAGAAIYLTSETPAFALAK